MESDDDLTLQRLRIVAKEELRLLEVTNATITTVLQTMGQRASAAFAVYSAIAALGLGAGIARIAGAFAKGAGIFAWTVALLVAISVLALIYAASSLLTLLPPDVIEIPLPSDDYLRIRASVLNDPELDPELETIRYSTAMFRRVVKHNGETLTQMAFQFRKARWAMGLSLAAMILAFALGLLIV